MKFRSIFLYVVSFLAFSVTASTHDHREPFLHCLSAHFTPNSTLLHTPNDASYPLILHSTIMNPRLAAAPNPAPKPLAIMAPACASHVSAAVLCARDHGVRIKTRSGGHDGEGLSYTSGSGVPYAILDLRNLRSVDVDSEAKTAWVQAGATVGELYYGIAKNSSTLGFPAGFCYTVGVGGHFSGGGYGVLMRKYGLASDNILDAKIVDVHGRVLDRDSMGEDLFWALRGGGAASFGVVLAWKIRLVDIPSKTSIISVARDMDDQKTKKLVHKWQEEAYNLDEDLLFFIAVTAVNEAGDRKQKPTLKAFFTSVFLGRPDEHFSLMEKSFPELGLAREDVIETTWLETSMLLFNGFPAGSPPELLLDRTRPEGRPVSSKMKDDYVQKPVPEAALAKLWDMLYEDDAGVATFLLLPYGARMSEIPEGETPFPHRAGNLYEITYITQWDEKGDTEASERHLNWTRSVHGFMTPYVSDNPRSAYLNVRDLDLGTSSWGRSYFKGNFERLVRVKTKVDPMNFFRDEQSIPPLQSQSSDQDGRMTCRNSGSDSEFLVSKYAYV